MKTTKTNIYIYIYSKTKIKNKFFKKLQLRKVHIIELKKAI